MTNDTTRRAEGLREAAVGVGDQLLHSPTAARGGLLCLGAATGLTAGVLLLRHRRGRGR